MLRISLIAAVVLSLVPLQAARSQPSPAASADAIVVRGEYLARAGDCVACHSAPGGRAFAGGLPMGTPLGTIVATNITPDIETGIGRYTLADFDAAMRRGIAPGGRHLYPAMPYPSYARLTDEDVAALYAYFTRAVAPVRQVNPPNQIPVLLSPRWPLAVWNALFAPTPGFKPTEGKDAAWNRGAYLVEGPGHCGACHTPRGTALQEVALDRNGAEFLAGANLDGWSAPSLRQEVATGLGRWTQAEIVEFLKTGHNRHGAAFGSMRDVIANSTPYLTDEDLSAMAIFLKSLPANTSERAPVTDPATAAMLLSANPTSPGARVYVQACQSCHLETGAGAPPFMPPLAHNPVVLDKDPTSLINIVLNGAAPLVVKGRPDPYRMPQYREQLSNQQIADVVTFIRAGWGNTATPVKLEDVAALRRSTDPASDRVVLLKMR
jgi:mono/diheme cytochrome c family protein